MEVTISSPRRRALRRSPGLVAALVAVLAGVAVAWFLASQDFGGNSASGGTLTVDSNLATDQLAFGSSAAGQGMYPTNDEGTIATQYKVDSFNITNNNPVTVSYDLAARCGLKDPGKRTVEDPAAPVTPCDADQLAQFEQIFVAIRQGSTVVYQGPLADLQPDALAQAITIDAGQAKTFNVRAWLNNLEDTEQPQGVVTPFIITITAETP